MYAVVLQTHYMDLPGPHAPHPTVQFNNFIGWQMSINIISLLQLLTYLARLSIQICFPDNYLQQYISIIVFASLLPPGWFIQKIYQYITPLRRVLIRICSILSNYLNFVNSLLGVTGSSILNECTEFGIYFFISYCCSLCIFKRFSGEQSMLFSTLPIANKLFVQH